MLALKRVGEFSTSILYLSLGGMLSPEDEQFIMFRNVDTTPALFRDNTPLKGRYTFGNY